jgi:8-oxo-dGTP pyrophosphatase MutT (NUDIX family)
MQSNLRFLVVGDYPPGTVRAAWVEDRRPRIPEIEAAIEVAWRETSRRLGSKLFDAPMCRLESFHAGPPLQLNISPTSYRAFVGTNLTNPQFAQLFGPAALANAIGVSSVVLSRDGFIVMGHRSDSVAFYPRRVHPFAGTLEPHDPLDVFAEARRELTEEAGIQDGDVQAMACIGLVEDAALCQPELIFAVRVRQDVAALQRSLDLVEHGSLFKVSADAPALAAAMAQPVLTPVAAAALSLLQRTRFAQLPV